MLYKFEWKSNIDNENYIYNDFYFEIGCMYYNYSVFYFNKGIDIISKKKKNKKNLLKNFLKSKNGFLEIKKIFLKFEKKKILKKIFFFLNLKIWIF